MHTILWKRVDREGRDACRIVQAYNRWVIEGSAAFEHGSNAASLVYRVVCDSEWRSIEASIKGWVGSLDIDVFIQAAQGENWSVNGTHVDSLEGLKDIDIGFTPATNTNAIRRLRLQVGEVVETTAVWLDADDWTVKPLPQSYRRIDSSTYEYSSPLHDFRAKLRTDRFGAVIDYPGLWLARGPNG
ncbi:MAG: putative glycolipid-binding domain-containing protein [Pusillimonas sp.]